LNSQAAKDQVSPIALFSEDGKHRKQPGGGETPIEWQYDERVTRLLIGSLEEDGAIDFQCPLDPTQSLTALYPNLTHLHLWGLQALQELPRLPGSLECLDMRHCASLRHIGPLPSSLNSLILNNCITLEDVSASNSLPDLQDLELAGCVKLSGQWIKSLLRDCGRLQRIDLSQCDQLGTIPCWPKKLDTIRLNNCETLEGLPLNWPETLRRLELSGCIKLVRLPDFPDSIDYVDLSHMHSLVQLPAQRAAPRTLYLYDSGLQEPHATDHGEHREEKVAEDVAS